MPPSIADPTRTHKPVAKRATLYTDVTLTHATQGVAVRMADGTVFFQEDTTGLWRQLFDADMPRVHLHGNLELIRVAEIIDGQNLALKCSKTLQKVA